MAEAGRPERRCLVITGGSSGIGASLVRAAARGGWRVWLGYASGQERASRIAAELQKSGADVLPIRLPLDDIEELQASLAHIASHGPAPEAAVLCGSLAPDLLSLLKLSADHFRRQHECAVVGNHALLGELWRRCFRPRGGGHVIAVLSAAQGPRPTPHMASYVVAKAGLEALLYAAEAEWGAGGLRASVVRPGFVDTPMLDVFSPLIIERALNTSGRPARPEAIAAAMLRALEYPPAPGTVAEIPLDGIHTSQRAS